jgi:2Fe-2S ferredoxin
MCLIQLNCLFSLQPNSEKYMAKVKFIFEDSEIKELTVVNVEAGYSVLEIAEENDVHLNHNCGGVCACSTCHVYILEGEEDLEEISDKEEDFIDRAINPRLESRLGCQAVILEDDAEIIVEIPDQKQIIGHEH